MRLLQQKIPYVRTVLLNQLVLIATTEQAGASVRREMALRQRVPMEQIRRALQGAHQLRSFQLHDVVPTGKQLGGGSYGEVVELRMSGLICAGKKIYDTLIDPENQVAIMSYNISRSLQYNNFECLLC